MIGFDETVFPQNAVLAIAERAPQVIDTDTRVFKRPLRNTDPNQSFGVFGNLWSPDADSFEMRGSRHPGPMEPTLQTYTIGIQSFVKDADEQKGLAIHSVFAQRVRTMLYRDDPLRVTLASLSSTAGEMTERVQRWGVNTQRLLSNELDGSWLYLSTLEFWVETQTTR